MDLYVCYGTFGPAERHPCAKAYRALTAVGLQPEVIRTYGCYGTDRFFSGRRAIKNLTGNYKVPTLVLDDGTVIDESQHIVAWAMKQTAPSAKAETSQTPPGAAV
jgi:hypothetical protein